MELRFGAPTPPWSINAERTKHWSWRAKRVKAWRLAAFVVTRASGIGELGPSVVEVELPVSKGPRRDPSNYLPAAKAVIDGVCQAGAWPDDNAEWVTLNEPVLVPGGSEVVVRITPRT